MTIAIVIILGVLLALRITWLLTMDRPRRYGTDADERHAAPLHVHGNQR
ncbi:hypothetical protein [Skermania piniformis]|uniref:Uncharacterized protein n=1 Tax=Skermania pinensis TaxID=39122 RepID=A0ABX8S8B7_9ACTN|nr:hypothetical protein [Skermania piniformis]QXQ13691.1 hypothetical protein KV203_18145 [Skermania piniformis]